MRLFAATFTALSCAAGAQADPAGSAPPRVAPAEVRETTPALADFTDRVLFGEVWQNKDLTPRDRSLATVIALIAGGHMPQLRPHLNRALDNGVKPREITGLITHLAFYAGWPNAMSAVTVAKEVFAQRGIQPETLAAGPEDTRLEVLRNGAQPTTLGSSENFTGTVKVDSRFQRSAPARLGGGTVSFEAGARTAWHSHPLGQTLIVTVGCGWVQQEGGPVEEIRPGDVVMIPPNARHWHGATASTAMTHIAIAEALDGNVVDWMEQVSDEDYSRGVAQQDRC
jgi:4-carboxymuconolactone decarboxylase